MQRARGGGSAQKVRIWPNIQIVPDNVKRLRPWWQRGPMRNVNLKQQEADRKVGERLVSLLDDAGKAQVEDLLARGQAIRAIRRVRELTNLGLYDARRLVEALDRSSAPSE